MLKAIEIKPDVFWVGGIDWNERNFHGYSRSPRGTITTLTQNAGPKAGVAICVGYGRV